MAKESKIEIKLIKSPIGYKKDQKQTLLALGLKRMNQIVTKPDNNGIRGMVRKVLHLIELKEIS